MDNKPSIPRRWFRFAWATLLSGLLVVFAARSIPATPSLPTAIMADGSILTVEAVAASNSPVFESPSWFSQTWPGRVWQRLHPSIFGLDTTPLHDNWDEVFSEKNKSRSFADPALWVWISIYDPKTGLYKEPSPRLRGILFDQRGEDSYNKAWGETNTVKSTCGGKPVFGYAWPFFHRPSTQFLLHFSQFEKNGECAFLIPNPAVSDRQMPWASQATPDPPAQAIEGLSVQLKAKETGLSTNGYRDFSEATTVRHNGIDVSKHYQRTTDSFIDAWGVFSWGYIDSGRPASKVTLKIEEDFGTMPPPTGQKLNLAGLKKPEDGEIILLQRSFGTPDCTVQAVALLGCGVYRIQDGSIQKVRALTAFESRIAPAFPAEPSFLEVLSKRGQLELKSTPEFLVTIPSILIFKENEHSIWPPRGSYWAQGYMLATLVWDDKLITHPDCLAVPKSYKLVFYYKAGEPRQSEPPEATNSP